MMKWMVCACLVALAAPSYAASLGSAHEAEAVSRQKRHLPYGGGPVDSFNNAGPMGPVDAFLDNLVGADDSSSSEELDDLLAELEEVKKSPVLDFATIEERVAEIQEQIAAIEKAPPATTAPPVNAAEAAAEAAEQQQAQQSNQEQQQADTVSAAEQAAEAAEQAPPPPEPASPSGPDGSNTEDGDGNGNNGAEASAGSEGGGGGGGVDIGAQQEAAAQQQEAAASAAGDPPAAPTTPEPVPVEPQQGNSIDYGNEDTKS